MACMGFCSQIAHPADLGPAPAIDRLAIRVHEYDDELPARVVVVKVSLQGFILYFQLAFRIVAEGMVRLL